MTRTSGTTSDSTKAKKNRLLSELSVDDILGCVKKLNSGRSRGEVNNEYGLYERSNCELCTEDIIETFERDCPICGSYIVSRIIRPEAMPDSVSKWKPFEICFKCAYRKYLEKTK